MRVSQESLQDVLLECLAGMLRPIVRLMLSCGVGHGEFAAVAKTVFVQVATDAYGIRGRPTNISRVAAITGLPRKLVSKIRTIPKESPWLPDMKRSPLNTVIHYWRFDDEFCSRPGIPSDLSTERFAALTKKCVGDLPAGAIRQELLRSGLAVQTEHGRLKLAKYYSFPEAFNEDFIRNMSFSLRNHGETLFHNAEMVQEGRASESEHTARGRFERYAWSNRLSPDAMFRFQSWVRTQGSEFLQRADEWIGLNEPSGGGRGGPCGVGVYFFRQDEEQSTNQE